MSRRVYAELVLDRARGHSAPGHCPDPGVSVLAQGQTTFGSILGTAVIFAAGIGLILREYVEIDRLTQACLDAGEWCFPVPGAFTRFAIYASIGMVQVFALFTLSLFFEERARRRGYAPEWRR